MSSVGELAAPEIIGIGLDIGGRLIGDRLLLFRQQTHLQLADDRMGDLVLDGEDVGQVAVVTLGPEMVAIGGVDQLTGDAHAFADDAHTSSST